jgi:hypothetical protein
MAMIEPNDEEKQEKLANDFSTPFSPPSGIQDNSDDTHPEADTNVDEQERYDEGISGASGVDDPGDRGISGYTPAPRSDDNQDLDEEE